MTDSDLSKLLLESPALKNELAMADGQTGFPPWDDDCRIIGRLRSEKVSESCHVLIIVESSVSQQLPLQCHQKW